MKNALPTLIGFLVLAAVGFVASRAFLDRLMREHCASPKAEAALRASPAYRSFLARWSLAVYFTMRHQEVAESLEGLLAPSAAAKAAPLKAPSKPDGFLLPHTERAAELQDLEK